MVVTFRSAAFNTSAPDSLFISPMPYGSDLANWLIHELTRYDAKTQPLILQSGSAWLVRFRFRRASYDLLVCFREPHWVGVLTLTRGLLSRFFRWPQRRVEFEAVAFVHSLVSSSQLVFDVHWRYDDDAEAMQE